MIKNTSDYSPVAHWDDQTRNMPEELLEECQEFDVADYVKTKADVRELLSAAADEDLGDGNVIRAVLKHVARTQNISALARDTGLNRGNLYEALSEDGNPTVATPLKITRSLGLRRRLEPVEGPHERVFLLNSPSVICA